jgi:hypothetical protein
VATNLFSHILSDKSHSELVEIASRIEAKWVLLDGDIDIDVLTDMIKGGIGAMEDLDRDLLMDHLSERYDNVRDLLELENLTKPQFLAGNWD